MHLYVKQLLKLCIVVAMVLCFYFFWGLLLLSANLEERGVLLLRLNIVS